MFEIERKIYFIAILDLDVQTGTRSESDLIL